MLQAPNLCRDVEGNQEIKTYSSHISPKSPFLSHHTTRYHGHPGILQGGQQHPSAGPGGKYLSKQVYSFTPKQTPFPATPNHNIALKYEHWKATTVLGKEGYSSQHSTYHFCLLPAFQAKSNNHKKEKPLEFDKAFQFRRNQGKVPGKGRETTFF